MLEIFVIAFCIYFAFTIYTSLMQIGYVKNAKSLQSIILDSSKYIEAGNYSIEKEKLAIVSSFYDFILFILWIGFGLSFLDSLIQIESFLLKAVVFVDLFIIINWFLTLPFELYSTFKLNKKYVLSITSEKLIYQLRILMSSFNCITRLAEKDLTIYNPRTFYKLN